MKDIGSCRYKCKHDQIGVHTGAVKMVKKGNGQINRYHQQVLAKIKMAVFYQQKAGNKKAMKKQGSAKKWC